MRRLHDRLHRPFLVVYLTCVTRIDKLLARLLARPEDFSYDELRHLLFRYGYEEVRPGKTSGSRVGFVNRRTKHIIHLHRPHPGPHVKLYQIEMIIDELKEIGVIP